VTEPWEWSPKYGVTMVYKPGTYNVPSACATLAVAAGKAVRMRKPSRDEEPTCAHVETRESAEDGWAKVERVGEPAFLIEAPGG
jgi:hypothetical protein